MKRLTPLARGRQSPQTDAAPALACLTGSRGQTFVDNLGERSLVLLDAWCITTAPVQQATLQTTNTCWEVTYGLAQTNTAVAFEAE